MVKLLHKPSSLASLLSGLALVVLCAGVAAQTPVQIRPAAKPPAQKPAARPAPAQRVDDRQWQTLADQAEDLLSKGDFSGSERVARDLVEEAKRVFAPDHANIATSLSILDGSLLKQGRYPEAESI